MEILTAAEKEDALNNSLETFNFHPKYFIHSVNKGANIKFCIASKNPIDGFNTHTSFKSYDEMNQFLMGYNLALTKPLT